ncbi:MAG: hypothetical protein QW356_03925 [Candidatus Hadarchaeales archaeon]
MEIEKWKKIIGGKRLLRVTDVMRLARELRVVRLGANTVAVERGGMCKRCGRPFTERVVVEFERPQRLSYFQAYLLFSVFAMGRRPYDYADYHRCSAGAEFVSNISRVEVLGDG